MSEHTLECGHSHSLCELVSRAINCKNEYCPVCNKPWSNEEGFYLSYINTETITFNEYLLQEEQRKQEREQSLFLNKNICRKLSSVCVGVTLTGKACRNLAKKGSTFCSRHIH